MKYVMTNLGPIIFPETISHVMLRGVHSVKNNILIESAGFVDNINFGAAVCYGESESLKIKSNAGDTDKMFDFCAMKRLPFNRTVEMIESSVAAKQAKTSNR